MGNPLILYSEAQVALKEGKRQEASELLGQAMGGHGSPVVESGLERLLSPDNDAGDLVCHAVALETVKRRWGKGQYPERKKEVLSGTS
jgi:hypothetical protein